jgi:hypothetical protein
MSDMKELALNVAVLKALADKVAEAAAQARTALLQEMAATGAEKVTAQIGDHKVASVSLVGGHKVTAVVVDEADLLAWVKQHRPEEIEERVRPAYRKALLDELGSNGEEVPGVELSLSTAYLSNRFAGDGKAAIAQAWTSGALALPEILALPAGGDGDAAS